MPTYLHVTYLQSSPFSLRVSDSTAKVGKSHLCPTPHCIKSALIDRFAERHSESDLIAFFRLIEPLTICFLLPQNVVVNQSFYRQFKPARGDSESEDPYQSSIIYKEYVHYSDFGIIFDVTSLSSTQIDALLKTCIQIQYLGKRDAIVVFKEHSIINALPDHLIKPIALGFDQGMIFGLDDWMHDRSPNTEKEYLANLREKGGLGKAADRNFIDYGFPYVLTSSTKNYTCYSRI